MTDEQIKNRIKEFLKKHQLTVISTIDTDAHKPEAAVIAFAEKEDLSLIFGTSAKSRKYKNIQKNPNVSFVIGWDREGTVQYEGMARELSEDEVNKHSELMSLKNKQMEKFRSNPEQRFFLATPNWIRLVDNSPEMQGIYEIAL